MVSVDVTEAPYLRTYFTSFYFFFFFKMFLGVDSLSLSLSLSLALSGPFFRLSSENRNCFQTPVNPGNSTDPVCSIMQGTPTHITWHLL